MSDSNPRIGEQTPLYPFGYGFCQWGCQRITRLNPDGIWASYIEGHEAILEMSESVVDAERGQLGSKPGGEEKASIGAKQEPNFGEKTRFYPFGYGYLPTAGK